MATHVMKIRPHFIESIRQGVKKHEYRLGTPERKAITTGDTLVLISNQDPSVFVRAIVDDIQVFSDWETALKDRWESDFRGLYSRFEDLIKECHRFYSAEQVDRFGIVVFGIRPDVVSYKKKRYILDTNIIIHRESHDETLPIAGKLYHWIDTLDGTKLFHPSLHDELRKYKDSTIVKSFSGKLQAYEQIVPFTDEDPFFTAATEAQGDANSIIDNGLLLQIYSGRADFLLTEDKGILRKAEALYIRDRVLTPEEFVHAMETANPSLVDYEVLSIKKDKIGSLSVNDSFFDSLREDYGYSDFNRWLHKKSGEDAYIFKDKDGKLQGFLCLKWEDEKEPFSDFEKPMKKQRWLKVRTFKNASKGMRLGERFLKIIFDNASMSGVDGIYVTLFDNKRDGVIVLMNLMKKWGFVPYCHKRNGELVMIKEMHRYNASMDPMFNYPLLKDGHGFMFLPIEATWHGKLFPDLHLKDENMSIYENEPCSYAVEKIYVCGWSRINARPGDLVFIYRKGEYWPKKYHSAILGMAILQEIIYPKSEEEYLGLVKNKSVFTDDELKSFYRNDKYRTVIKLLFLKPFDRKVTLKQLYDLGIFDETCNEAPRINTIISNEDADKIIREGERQ